MVSTATGQIPLIEFKPTWVEKETNRSPLEEIRRHLNPHFVKIYRMWESLEVASTKRPPQGFLILRIDGKDKVNTWNVIICMTFSFVLREHLRSFYKFKNTILLHLKNLDGATLNVFLSLK